MRLESRTPQAAARPAPLGGEPFHAATHLKPPLQGLRSRAPPAADAARRSRGSGRRMQAPRQGAQHDAPTATRGCLRSRLRGPAPPGKYNISGNFLFRPDVGAACRPPAPGSPAIPLWANKIRVSSFLCKGGPKKFQKRSAPVRLRLRTGAFGVFRSV